MLQQQVAKPLAKTGNSPAKSRNAGLERHHTLKARLRARLAGWAFGNIAVAPPGVQRKLSVGAVDDPLEHEAERAADQVMRASEPQVSRATPRVRISRKCSACEEEEAGHPQRAPEASGSTSRSS